jgi:hypothetical protein
MVLSPNPANQIVAIQWNGFNSAETWVRLLNSLGQLIEVKKANTLDKAVFQVQGLAKGLYQVEVQDSKNRLTQKLIIE